MKSEDQRLFLKFICILETCTAIACYFFNWNIILYTYSIFFSNWNLAGWLMIKYTVYSVVYKTHLFILFYSDLNGWPKYWSKWGMCDVMFENQFWVFFSKYCCVFQNLMRKHNVLLHQRWVWGNLSIILIQFSVDQRSVGASMWDLLGKCLWFTLNKPNQIEPKPMITTTMSLQLVYKIHQHFLYNFNFGFTKHSLGRATCLYLLLLPIHIYWNTRFGFDSFRTMSAVI